MIINKHIMRSTNKKLVMQQIINEGPISRSQISRNLDLNKVTVSDIYNNLVEVGLVREVGRGGSSQNGGRRPVMGELDTSRYFVIAMRLMRKTVSIRASRLNAHQVAFSTIDTAKMSMTELLDQATSTMKQMVEKLPTLELAGICVAVEGTTFENRIVTPAIPELKNFDVAKYFTDQLHVPTLVENSANLAAVYERDFYGHGLFHDIVALLISDHLRAGIVADDRLYIGHEGHAGEVGNAYLVDRHDHSQMAAADEYAAQSVLLADMKKRMNWPSVTLEQVVSAYKEREPEAIAAFDDFAYYLARVITTLSASLAPDVIILNSDIFAALPRVLDTVRKHFSLMAPDKVTPILLTQDVRSATLLGATSFIIHHVLGLDDLNLQFREPVD